MYKIHLCLFTSNLQFSATSKFFKFLLPHPMLSRANPISYLRFGEHPCGSSRVIHYFRHFFLHLGSQSVCYTINVPDGYSTFLCCISCHQQASHLHGITISSSLRRSSLQLATWTSWTTWQTSCSRHVRHLCHTYVLAPSVVSILSPNLISITLLTPVLFYIISLFSLLYICQLGILTFCFIPIIHS